MLIQAAFQVSVIGLSMGTLIFGKEGQVRQVADMGVQIDGKVFTQAQLKQHLNRHLLLDKLMSQAIPNIIYGMLFQV
jgi:hypothetical protein